ncbi:Mu transposase C-terminal domain-containing protein [Mucilaginibacter sp. SMC90]|uniref:Mu transposase C-terminal domain-containing protein n=1 Tax=Mucilaginibacter sp. SMC90 TaxID=2929803 RepID=UPI001FB281AB|nr:Mu transposase C-terminal domain-containing protein [Mucilaginibacter sp. SMC90]UOE48019.1 Mu transposase C-terminal domain-containing protein [Mucilaginibacter sp. SMC90]
MKYNELNNLCLEYHELVPGLMSVENYNKSRQRGTITVYGYGGLGREVLIDYESLSDERKKKIIEKYGNPYEYIVKQPLTDWVTINWNQKAFDFYNNTNGKGYTLPSGLNLPEAYRDKYTKAVSYMDGIIHYTTDKMALKRDFNITMAAFWSIVADVIKAEKVGLPPNETRLKEKIKAYKAQGFPVLIEQYRFGNDNSKKVKDQQAEDTLMHLIALDNKHDDVVISQAYNMWALENGRKTITPQAVGYRRRENYHEVIIAREGKAAAYNKYNKQIKQARPTAPLIYVNSDDNVLDLYFTETTYKDGRKNVNRYYRPVMYVVVDNYNDYPLGYAIGETVTIELIKQAYRNAMAHIVELTGDAYLWHQIKSDKWSIDPALKGDLATFLKMGGESTFFTASVAQSKYIERVFSHPLHKILKMYPNYSGANITARGANARPNAEALQKRSANFPDKKHAPAVIEMTINQMRHAQMPGTDLTRQEYWLKGFHESEISQKKRLSVERKIEILGAKHQLRDPRESLRLQPAGLNFQLNNIKYSFDIPAKYFPECVNKKVDVYYDPADMSQVLVTDHSGIRFVTGQYVLQPSAVADMQEGDGHRLHERKEEKKAITQKMVDYVTSRDERLQRAEIDAQSILQAGVLVKAINHKAQKQIGGYEEQYDDVQIEHKARPKAPKITQSIYDEM